MIGLERGSRASPAKQRGAGGGQASVRARALLGTHRPPGTGVLGRGGAGASARSRGAVMVVVVTSYRHRLTLCNNSSTTNHLNLRMVYNNTAELYLLL